MQQNDLQQNRLREPIVSVLGHVDHGKTTLLDAIRLTTEANKEAGGITQRIGATEIRSKDLILRSHGMLNETNLRIPGILFIDTPGHVAFSNMRVRGGVLADIAILVVDINEGFMPQTLESVNILKKFKTPFVIAANKIDLVPYFIQLKNETLKNVMKIQRPEYIDEFNNRMYLLMGRLSELNISADQYDRITDFTKSVAIVPVSAKYNIGMAELMTVLAGLSQKFLEKNIRFEASNSKGTVIEVKKEESVGTTLDTVLYQGILRKGDIIAVNTKAGPAVTGVKALLVNSGSGGKRLVEKDKVYSAAGVRVLIQDKLDIVNGSPLIVTDGNREEAFQEIRENSTVNVELSENGISIKADAIGSLEALAYELKSLGISIRSAETGDVTKKDIVNAETLNNPLDRLIVAFNVPITPDAKEYLLSSDVGVISGGVIYSIVNEASEWLKKKKEDLLEQRKRDYSIPSKFIILPQYIFRSTKPVIVGISVQAGRLKVGDKLIRSDGRFAGTVKSIRENDTSKQFVDAPAEVAVSIEGVTLNRQIFPEEPIYVDIQESVVPLLRKEKLDDDTMQTLEEIINIKRKENKFWGTRA
ncbi:MAG: translation initiation factor IF-2 [Candidatus Thermoplasmatota archaeon]|jgi:translation initiation factor 5B|nr:translation initiation factor IF-2 [Candidatus Thermoplasmatota archaeon]